MTTSIERPCRSPAWACLLIGIGLTLLGAALAIGWLCLADAMAWEAGAKLIWPDVLGPLAIAVLPAAARVVPLFLARRQREATYTLIGGVIGMVLAVFSALILIGIGLAAGMPRHD